MTGEDTPWDRAMPLDPYHVSAFKPAATDDHLENNLLAVENERLRAENAILKSALRAANRITSPYADQRTPSGTPPRR
jgi:hypothetical protein